MKKSLILENQKPNEKLNRWGQIQKNTAPKYSKAAIGAAIIVKSCKDYSKAKICSLGKAPDTRCVA